MREQLFKGAASVGNRAPACLDKLHERSEHQPQQRAVLRRNEQTRPSSASDRSKRASEASTSPSGELCDEVGGYQVRCASSC
jgi:hypothetical protein